jgi:ribosomal protein S18 acetylase RimI-like enzyme
MEIAIRPMTEDDLPVVSAIYAAHTGVAPPADWRDRVLPLLHQAAAGAAALVAEAREAEAEAVRVGDVVGYAVGEVRGWEFGSEPTGWIFGLGVAPALARRAIASRLLEAAQRALARAGVRTVRTMVRGDDVPVLTFFRTSGFVAGPYIELERTVSEGSP